MVDLCKVYSVAGDVRVTVLASRLVLTFKDVTGDVVDVEMPYPIGERMAQGLAVAVLGKQRERGETAAWLEVQR